MKTRIAFFCVASLISALCVNSSTANPVGGSVVGGDANATITGQGTPLTTINQSARNVVINWQDFSIGAGEVTRFVQPSATASALNRVISGNPSLIYGRLEADGQVFVINRNGILVGPNGQIDTKSFTASTLDVSDASFMAGGDLVFSGTSAAGIRNEGTISALGGNVYLIAHTVENAGTISAPQGTVGLAAGSQVRLVQSGNERLSVLAGNPAAPADTGVNNAGTIQAATAELKAAGGNIYALAINNGGVVRATGIARRNGRVYLTASGGNIENSGVISANNANGSGGTIVLDGGHNATAPATVTSSGTIEARGDVAGTKGGLVNILGDRVGLLDSAVVDVSGRAGGGTVLVGGDYQGANPAMQNAAMTTVAAGAQIRADALSSGDAGTVVVWADDTTMFEGTINARALGAAGQGGVAEISGKQHLLITGHAYLTGAGGQSGSLLLDPGSVSIQHEASGNTPPSANLDVFFDDWIVNQLNTGGANLTISTANSLNAAAEDLTVLTGANISWNSLRSLTLIGNNSLTTQAGSIIANAGTGSLSLQSGSGNVTLGGSINMGLAANLSITAAGTVAINDNITAVSVTAQSGTAGSGNLSFGAGVTVNADVQSYQAGDGTAGGGAGSAADLTANAPNFRNTAGSAAPSTFTYLQDAAITDVNIPVVAQFGGTAPADYTIQSDDSTLIMTTPAKVAGSALTLFANGNLTFGGSTAGELWTLAQLVAQSAENILLAGDVTATAVGVRSGTDGSGNITFANLPGAAVVNVNADTQIYWAGNASGGGSTANLTGFSPVFRNTANTADPAYFYFWQEATIAASGVPTISPTTSYVIQSDNGDVTLPALNLPGNLSVSAGGTITDNGNLDVTGLASFTSTASGASGNITLDSAGNDFGSLRLNSANGEAVSVREASATALDTVTVDNGTLTVNSGGAISQVAGRTVTAGGLASFTSTGSGTDGDITLNNAGNQFGSLALSSANGSAVSVTEQSATALGAVAVNAGTLAVNSGGDITQVGGQTITVGGAASFTAPLGGSIILGNAGNTFNGTVDFVGNGGPLLNVTVRDTTALVLQGLTIGGILDVTSGGPISQSGTLEAGGLASFTATASGANGNITLNDAGNDFGSLALTSANGSAVSVTEQSATALGAVAVNTGTLTVNSGGNITQVGGQTITVGGAASFTAPLGGSINLGNAGNTFNGTLSFAGAGGNLLNVTVLDTTAINLPALSINGNLIVTAGGAITDGGNLIVPGTTTLAAGAGNDITLNNNNDFGTVAVTSGRNVTLNDVSGLNLGASTISGTLEVTASGTITDSGNLLVTGTTTLAAGAGNDIALDSNNDFNTVTITSARNVTLNDTDGIDLGASTVSGALGVTANGPITDSGNLLVTGAATLGAGAGNDITLNNNNDFSSVAISSGRDVTLNDQNAINLGPLTVSGNLGVTANGLVDFTGFGGGTIQGTLGITTTVGGIADSGMYLAGTTFLTVGGATTLAAGAGNDINLNNNNNFSTVTITSGRNVVLYDGNGLNLGPSTVSGTLGVTARGNITQGGALNVASGASTFTIDTVGGADVLLGDQANNFAGQLVTINTINGGGVRDVSLRNVNASALFPSLPSGLRNLTLLFDAASATLPALTLGGNLNVTAVGISQTGTLQMGGSGQTATFSAGTGNDISLGLVNNNFNIIVVNGRDVTVRDANDIVFGPPASTAFNLTVIAGGNVHFNSPPTSLVQNDLNLTAGGNLTGELIVNGNRYISVGGVNNASLKSSLAGLSVVNIPLPKLETVSFSGATIDAEEAAKILPPGCIGVLALQVPFPKSEEEAYQIEKYSKWTHQGIMAALHRTTEKPAAE